MPPAVGAAALDRLSRLPAREQSLQTLLQTVVELTPSVLPGETETSVTLVTRERPTTAASTGPLAVELDRYQYAAGRGPCLHAARTGDVADVPDTCTEERWPEYAQRAAECGALASLSLPLAFDPDEQLAGSLNIYARRGYTFAPANREAATRFAGLAGVATRNLAARQRAEDRAAHLQTAMESRAAIEQAKGILMERHKLTSDQAFHVLAEASMASHRKIRDLAERLVDSGELPGW